MRRGADAGCSRPASGTAPAAASVAPMKSRIARSGAGGAVRSAIVVRILRRKYLPTIPLMRNPATVSVCPGPHAEATGYGIRSNGPSATARVPNCNLCIYLVTIKWGGIFIE